MTDFDLRVTFDQHPSTETIAAFDGGPEVEVPMFPNQRLVRVNGKGIAYLSLDSGGLNFTMPVHDAVAGVVVDACKAYFDEHKIEAEVVPSQPPQVVNVEDE